LILSAARCVSAGCDSNRLGFQRLNLLPDQRSNPMLGQIHAKHAKTERPKLNRLWTAIVGFSLAWAGALQAASTIQFTATNYTVAEDAGAVTLTVQRLDDTSTVVSVDYASTNGTATAGQDCTETKGTLAFAAGEKVKLFTVPILNDSLKEPSETFRITLSNPTGGGVLGSTETATITILETTGMVAHRFDNIAGLQDQGAQLTLGGGVHKRFKDYFDLYPIEVSTNLVAWEPLVTVVRTNSATNVLPYLDAAVAKSDRRFYRTVANHLITPIAKPTGPFRVGVARLSGLDPSAEKVVGASD
jgi:hypothetical protein